MKKLLYLLLLTPIIYLASCSSAKDGLTPETGSIEEKIVDKTWKLLGLDEGWFRLNDNNTYLTKDYRCDILEEFGTWELDGSVLVMKHTIGPLEYIERNTIVEYNDSIVKIQADTNPTTDVNIIFEVTAVVVRGCMDLTAENYNPLADCEDGSCIGGIAIGNEYQGGKIFYIDESGLHGLIYREVYGMEETWGCAWYDENINDWDGIYIGETSTGFGTGQSNTTRIINVCEENSYAKWCDDFSVEDNTGEVYNDWYLPSLSEVSVLLENIGPFGTWIFTSSEKSHTEAWGIFGSNGTVEGLIKLGNGNSNKIAIRSF